jgi:hypothetical protein
MEPDVISIGILERRLYRNLHATFEIIRKQSSASPRRSAGGIYLDS